jgi:hypothetical protein
MTVCETMEEAILRIRQIRASLLLKEDDVLDAKVSAALDGSINALYDAEKHLNKLF